MLEGKALIVAVMMLTAAPIAATDEGQAFLGEITYDLGEMLDTDEEENKVNDRKLDDANIEDKDLLLTDENLEVDCLTLEQWKEEFSPEEKVGDERKESKENDKARGNDDSKEDEKGDEKKENYPDKEDWADKETVAKDDDCLTAEEWVLKFESNEEEPCFTLEDLEKKMKDDRKDWDHDWESDWNEEWAEELELLAEACKGGNEEACEELLAIREELAEEEYLTFNPGVIVGGTNTNYGSAVFIIDLENGGHILKRIDLTDNPGGVANSVPSTVEFVTADTTSAATYKGAMVYLVDLESKLWKINLTDQGTLYDKTLLFNSQGDRTNGRISWYTPTITLNANKKLWLYYGTGDLTNLQQMTAGLGNHIYGIQDASFPLFTSTIAGTLPNLTNITPAASICPSGADLGWYRTLDVNEKVTGKIAIYNETLFVSRYTPNITNLCTPGTAVLSEHGSACGNQLGSSSLGPGVATSPIVHKGKIYVGISGEGGGSTPLGAGYQRTDNIIVGEPTNAGSLTDGKATLESWREIW